MASKIFSCLNLGLEPQIVEVEADKTKGLRNFNIVGLADKAVSESKERVESAIRNSGFLSPLKSNFRVLINLAPADIKKEGSLYDLPIALAYLLETKQTKFDPFNKLFIGELSLDGKIRKVKGAVLASILAKENNFKEIILPKENSLEAGLVEGIKIIGVSSLKEAVFYLENKIKILPQKTDISKINFNQEAFDISWIKGQEKAKRALEIVAAGFHHFLMIGPPGTGKSLLAKSITSILPELTFEEMLEVTKIYSLSGLLNKNRPIINFRPFRSPHHTSSVAAMVGGGSPPKPGEVSLAHRGILFLDEFPEFHRDVLESLREPIEEGKITIQRAKSGYTFPSQFTLIAAANPYNSDDNNYYSPVQFYAYQRKMNSPLIDRIDLFSYVQRVEFEKLSTKYQNFSNETNFIKNKIKKARDIQLKRFKNEKGIFANSQMKIPQIEKYCQIDSKSKNLLKSYVNSGKLSARGYHRVLKVARTIADLEEKELISFDNVAEALMYRVKEKESF